MCRCWENVVRKFLNDVRVFCCTCSSDGFLAGKDLNRKSLLPDDSCIDMARSFLLKSRVLTVFQYKYRPGSGLNKYKRWLPLLIGKFKFRSVEFSFGTLFLNR